VREVVNLRRGNENYDEYVGGAVRWRGLGRSPWHNPFARRMRRGEITREECVRLYEEYISTRPDLLDSLATTVEEQGGRLGCWCAPEPCHADVLVRLLKNREEKQMSPLERTARREARRRILDPDHEERLEKCREAIATDKKRYASQNNG